MVIIDHNKNPKEKAGKVYLLDVARKTLNDHTSHATDMFFQAASRYREIKTYTLGQQSVSGYQKQYIDSKTNKTYTNLDWRPRPIVSKYRDKVISMLLQRDYNIICTPIDALAKDDADKYFADVRVKILMRDALKKANPELAESPVLMPEPGEALDLEELEMQMNYTWKHQMAVEAENAWRLVSYQNDFKEERKITLTNLYDYGVGGYKEYIENGRTKIRAINPENMVTGHCRFGDFRDCHTIGEIIEVPVTELSKYFTEDELKQIASTRRNRFMNNGTKPFKDDANSFEVLDLEIKTYDDWVYENRENKAGNMRFNRTNYEFKDKFDAVVMIKGKEEKKFVSRTVTNIYKVKWIIDTDFVYEYGLDKNMKRDNINWCDTTSRYHLYAYNFYEMKCLSMMDRLIPIVDEYQMTIYKIQNFKNRWIPYIVDLDLDSLEAVSLGKGGDDMTPMELLDMLWQTNILLSRRRDVSATNPNYKGVEVRPTQMAEEFTVLVADLGRLLQDMADISGLNDLTDGSTPNAKLLTTPAQMGYEATQNAIFPLLDADRKLHERTAKGAIQRVQTAIRNGQTIQGIAPSLGANTLKFIKVSKDLALHDIGIMVQDMPTEQQKMMLLEKLNMKDAQGLIDPEDFVMVMETDNLKQARQLLAYKVKKRREKEQENQLAVQKAQSDGAIAAAQAAEQAKQQTLQMQHQFTMEEIALKNEGELAVAKLKVDAQTLDSQTNAGAKIAGHTIQQYGKEREKKIEQGIPVGDDEDMAAQLMQQQAPQEEMPVEELSPEQQMMEQQQVM